MATEFWSCTHPDRLACESPEEAIVEFFDEMTEDAVSRAENFCPLTVTRYVPMKITTVQSQAEYAAEAFQEHLDDEYGDPDGSTGDTLPKGAYKRLVSDLVDAFARAAATADVWMCEPAGERTFSADEVRRIILETEAVP